MSHGCDVAWNSSSPLFIRFSVKPITTVEITTPIISASCCFQGVAPIRKPVFRSCDVSPAFDAAMQTTLPMVIASTPNAGAVQPCTKKIAEVAISVAIVIPETGLAELPMSPTIRDATVTKRNPKTTTSREAARFASQPTCAPGTGLKVRKTNMITTSSADPPITTLMGRSSSVRTAAAFAPLPFRFFIPERSALTIVGIVFSSVISPAAATAPAPMGRTYVDHNSLGDIAAIGLVDGYSGRE